MQACRATRRSWLCPEIDPQAQGIFDAAALFLPEDSSFTAGAVRDLDAIAEWPEAQLARSALAPLLGLSSAHPPAAIPALNVGALNAEQIGAVRAACSAPLTVVTGPPGTGKSQAIVSMAASVLMAGGSVLVASKNHQALDAVQDRLGGLAPEAPFVVRTLDPSGEVDRSFATVLRDLVQGDTGAPRPLDDLLRDRLTELAMNRALALDLVAQRGEIECALADLLERIEARRKLPQPEGSTSVPDQAPRAGLVARVLSLLRSLFARAPADKKTAGVVLSGLAALEDDLAKLRTERDGLADPPDVIALTAEIADLARKVLAAVLMARTTVSHEARDRLDEAKADLDFAGTKAGLLGREAWGGGRENDRGFWQETKP